MNDFFKLPFQNECSWEMNQHTIMSQIDQFTDNWGTKATKNLWYDSL